MADDKNEVEEITSICNGLNINIGTLNERTIESMLLAGKVANAFNHPVLLDPVGAGASTLRTKTAQRLLKEVHFDVIRGNISEIKTLAYGSGSTKGVDANIADVITEDHLKEAVAFVKEFAKQTKSIVVVTGGIDLVSDMESCYVIRNGRAQMGEITGTGCQLSGMLTAFISANRENMLEACAAAVCTMGLAGEMAYSYLKEEEGNASYRNRIIDAVYRMNGEILESGAKYEVY